MSHACRPFYSRNFDTTSVDISINSLPKRTIYVVDRNLRGMADSKVWWKDLPCHYHPSWKLNEISQLDLNKLKHHIDRNENDLMVVERLLFAAFLEVPVGSPYNLSLPSVVKAREYLQQAENYVDSNLKENRDASIGYGIVINACRMWTGKPIPEWEETLFILKEERDKYPKHKHYISAVRAFALSRLGPEWVEEAKQHYEDALEGYSDNVQWMYGKALMVGRQARLKYPNVNSTKRLPEEYRDLLREEKSILENVLKCKEDFHIARAMYGQVLSNLGDWEIERAREEAPNNRSIAEIASKYYKKKNDIRKAREILEKLPGESKTAEVNFLIGNLYKSETYNERQCKNKMKMWKSALDNFEKALKLDERHYPALSSRAEMNARLENYSEARKQYADLLSSNLLDKPHLHKDKFFTLKNLLKLPAKTREKILTDEEYINYSHELLQIAVTNYSEEKDGKISLTGDERKPAENSIHALETVMSEERGANTRISSLAKLKLAHFYLLCREYDTATRLYLGLRDESSDFKQSAIWGLAKCYMGSGRYKEAKVTVDELSNQKQSSYRVQELHADISLSRAKLKLHKSENLNAEAVFGEKSNPVAGYTCGSAVTVYDELSTVALLEHAIEMGSLEACFMFLFKITQLQKYFLSKAQEIPRIIAKIEQLCCDKIINVHTDFRVSDFETEKYNKLTDSATEKKEIIKRKIEELLTYPDIERNVGISHANINNVYKKLSQLRRHLFNFELAVIRRKNSEWDENCEAEVTQVLREARFLLDHIISVYQDTLIKGKKANSDFCIHFDWKEGKEDKEKASKKLKGWLESKFPKCNLPENVIGVLLKVQPMYDEDNLWLAALHTFVNDVKHAGGARNVDESSAPIDDKRSDNDMYSFDLLKGANKGFLARRSCQKVEEIVQEILNEIKKLHANHTQQE